MRDHFEQTTEIPDGDTATPIQVKNVDSYHPDVHKEINYFPIYLPNLSSTRPMCVDCGVYKRIWIGSPIRVYYG